jgi:hypothetical protein
MENENFHKNLISLLKVFKNRPYHLSKYLIDNNAFNKDFIQKIQNSSKLSEINEIENKYFSSISQMEDFYNSLLEEGVVNSKKTKKDITIELNNKLAQLIIDERYEEAAALRDYMLKNRIKKN